MQPGESSTLSRRQPGDTSTLSRRQPGDTSTLSMREKSQLKRQTMREHNSNFRAGYISIDESYLTRTGIRGRKRYLLYCFVTVLGIISVLNAVALGWMVYAFCITHLGMASMEFAIPSHLLRVWAEAELPHVTLGSGVLGSRYQGSLSFTARDAALVLQEADNLNESNARVMLSDKFVNVSADSFMVVNSQTREVVFSPDTLMSLVGEATNLHASTVEVDKVSSLEGTRDLSVESFNKVVITGAEGVALESRGRISVSQIGSGNIFLNASMGQVTLSGSKLYFGSRLPHLLPGSNSSTPAYKLCVCRSSGRVFSVPVITPGYGCANASADFNPCGL